MHEGSEAPPSSRRAATQGKLAALEARLRDLRSVLVCYSGGIDSALLLAVAHRVLGERAVGLTAVSPSLAPSELDDARRTARAIGARHLLVESGELSIAEYASNPPDRCLHCKTELYRLAWDEQRRLGLAAVANGANVDDLADYRPGLEAARRAGVASPLVDAGFDKQDVRNAARALGLALWDKPAAACLASRVPYGTALTAGLLQRIARAERSIKELGFGQVRVRYHGELARIELEPDEVGRAAQPELRGRLVDALRTQGFQYVTLDLGGYRQGSLNEVLAEADTEAS